MKVLVLAPEMQHSHHLMIYSRQLQQSMEQLSIDEDTVDLMTFREVADAKSPLSFDLNQLSDYVEAADLINKHYDVCILQYQPAVYGGKGGNYIMNLAAQLSVPLLTAFHSIDSDPSALDKEIVHFLAERSQSVFVFSQLSVEFLEHYYKVNRDNILKTDYGVSVFQSIELTDRSTLLGIDAQKVIMACGAMDRLSGFETIINALPSLTKSYADLQLVIINTGAEDQYAREYAKSLMRLAVQRGVSTHVQLLQYSTITAELEVLMQAADVYVSAVVDDKRLDDLLLSMAVGSGAAVLSTPTWLANELLEDKKGSFFPFKSSSELSAELLLMLRNEREAQLYRSNASLYGAQTSWPVIAKRLKELFQGLTLVAAKPIQSIVNPSYLPDINLGHLNSLWWQSGFVNESVYGIPNLSKGYSLEDNALVLQVLVKASQWQDKETYRDAIQRCLALIQNMRNDEGIWLDVLSTCGKATGMATGMASEMAIGQLIYALGVTYAANVGQGLSDVSYDLLLDLINNHQLELPRAKALGVMGLANVLQVDNGNAECFDLFNSWSKDLIQLLPDDPYKSWQWHEDEIGEQAGLIPLALIHVYQLNRNKEVLSIIKRSLRFLEKHSLSDNRFSIRFTGLKKEEVKPKVAKEYKANETYLFTEIYTRLFELTKEEKYRKPGVKCHNWYLGDNSIGKSLYDISSGGCYHSFSGRTLNPAMSIQSTCAYWLSHFSVLDLHFHLLSAEV
jgi:glycosyltransferase involved in cell wall biosynthesis